MSYVLSCDEIHAESAAVASTLLDFLVELAERFSTNPSSAGSAVLLVVALAAATLADTLL
jgi:hypothetical protein